MDATKISIFESLSNPNDRENPIAANMLSPSKINWPQISSEWESSDLSQHEFCRQRGISYTRFRSYRTKESQKRKQACQLLPVKMKQDASLNLALKASSFTLHFLNGTRLSVPIQADPSTLKLILSCMGELQ